MPENDVLATGRRKTSVARVKVKIGSGKITVNGRNPEEYFPTKAHLIMIQKPLEITDYIGKLDILANVRGGGLSGQAGAITHGIARALLKLDPECKQALSKSGFLTRDPRMVERKKAGRPGARKRFQFSKR